MKILFLGYAVDRKEEKILSGVSIAGNKMQLNVLEELSKYNDLKIQAITIYPVAAFPREKKIWIGERKFHPITEVESIRVSFLNIPIIKQVSQIISVYIQAKRYIYKNKDAIVFTFNLFPQVGIPLMKLKRKYKIRSVALLADLPIDDNYKRKGIGKWFRYVFDRYTLKAIETCDEFIVLNKHAIEKYAPNKEFIVIEGGVDLKEYDLSKQEKNHKIKNIVYSGAINEYSGVRNLIKAMEFVEDKRIMLEIYGSGILEEEFKAHSSANVRFLGRVSNEKIKKIQRNAWLLVNPRPVDDEIAKVTFPSKIFEYMMSGTPVLTTRLNGFKKEYMDKMFFVENNDSKLMAEKINEINKLTDEVLKEQAFKAKAFVMNEKNWTVQSKKIYFLLKNKSN